MLRLNELKLPIDHTPADLEAAICGRLAMEASDLIHYSVVKRGNDARRKSAIALVYALDGNKVREVRVSIGKRLDGKVEVREGLAAGDMVVTAGNARLSDGAEVEAVPAAAAVE